MIIQQLQISSQGKQRRLPRSSSPRQRNQQLRVQKLSQPSGADVYINNAYKGVTPLSFENVPIDTTKTYSIDLRLEGYKPYTTAGSISPRRECSNQCCHYPLASPNHQVPSLPDAILEYLSLMGLLSVILMKKQ